MSRHDIFGSILANESIHQTILGNFFDAQEENQWFGENRSKYYALQEPYVEILDPQVCVWQFLNKNELTEYLKIRKKNEIKRYLNLLQMNKYSPKGIARLIFVELMLSVTKFCKRCNYNLEKSGALLSQFYLTHILTTSSSDRSTEKVYNYFKELALAHTLPDFPPKSAKIFSQQETKKNMEFFCKIYLRNLPLIRFVSVPNFAFYFLYEVEQIQLTRERKKDKGAKKKRNKSKTRKGKKKRK